MGSPLLQSFLLNSGVIFCGKKIKFVVVSINLVYSPEYSGL